MLGGQAVSQGVAVMGVRDSLHFSALWWEAEWLASRGLIAIIMVNSKAFVAPHGGQQRVFGTNPMAFAFPRSEAPPLVWDQVCSAPSPLCTELPDPLAKGLQRDGERGHAAGS